VIVPSHSLERIALRHWRLQPHAISRIPNGIAPLGSSGGPPARVREQAGVGASSRVLATVAHLRPEKRLDRLIDAVARLSAGLDAHLLIVGDGPERGRLLEHAAAARIGDRVHFLGHRTDVHAILAAADLFVLSSDTEQMPISLLEAMAAGLPVVATRVGDVADMLPPEHGRFVVRVDGQSTAAALADRIAELLSQPDLCVAVGRANRLRVREEYGFDRMRDAYSAEYERALAGCSP
jgi:glycosyltransferase involved in cell wall biosynthesis